MSALKPFLLRKMTARRAMAAFAALALLCFAAGGTFLHEHKAGRSDTPCHVCQSLHLPALAAISGLVLDAPQVDLKQLAEVAVASSNDSLAFPHAGRAPPFV